MPMPKVLLPTAFCSANLIIYWGTFGNTWKLVCAMALGLVMFAIGAWRSHTGAQRTLRNAIWVAPWFGGHLLIGAFGRYGAIRQVLPAWIDIVIMIAFALGIFYLALSLTLTREQAAAEIAKDAYQLDYEKH